MRYADGSKVENLPRRRYLPELAAMQVAEHPSEVPLQSGCESIPLTGLLKRPEFSLVIVPGWQKVHSRVASLRPRYPDCTPGVFYEMLLERLELNP
jgi:hypothetical protein